MTGGGGEGNGKNRERLFRSVTMPADFASNYTHVLSENKFFPNLRGTKKNMPATDYNGKFCYFSTVFSLKLFSRFTRFNQIQPLVLYKSLVYTRRSNPGKITSPKSSISN